MFTSKKTAWLLLGSAIILALSLGVRHAFGLFLQPMSLEFGWGRETFAFAIALQNLIWGLAQPFVGAFADRYGVRPTVLVSALAYALGLWLMSAAATSGMLYLSTGLLIGFGLSGTSFAVLLSVVGRSVVPEKRSMAMGIASAAGSFGQFAMLPGTLGLIQWLGWAGALTVCAMLIMLIVPPPVASAKRWAAHCLKPVGTRHSGGCRSAILYAVFRWCLLAYTCPLT